MPPSFPSLVESLKRLSTADEKLSTINQYLQELDDPPPFQLQSNSGTPSHPYYKDLNTDIEKLHALVEEHGLVDGMTKLVDSRCERVTLKQGTHFPPPLKTIGCGNHDVCKNCFCENDGVKFCAGCRLIKYCSKACQSENWKIHKIDCRSPANSDKWKPHWEEERRKPDFVRGPHAVLQSFFGGTGMILWGNVPAIDILALKNNEGIHASKNRDFALAFVASGDLRNVICTVNALPEDYSGTLSLVLNDFNPLVVCRNLLILAILGLIEDVEEGSEHAIHIWYSLFQPQSYIPRITPALAQSEVFKNLNGTRASLTKTTSISSTLDPSTILELLTRVSSNTIQPSHASNAYNGVMNVPQRVDYRDRFYASLKPSHRVAFKEWRSFGLVMPFGAPNAHMALPNRWLFSPDGNLCLSDNANPLEGWDPKSVFASGKAHGTSEEDIFGCLFFHVKDQLIEFSKRLRRFKINIFLSDVEATSLPKVLAKTAVCPTVFDRIEVSNIVDSNYVGVPRVLSTFGPLLNPENKSAAIVGLFMNWVLSMPSGSISTSEAASPSDLHEAMKNISKKLPQVVRLPGWENDPKMFEFMTALDAFHNNAIAFREYLKQSGEPAAAGAAGIRLRSINKIVPPRMHVPLGSSFDAIVDVKNMDDWYNITALTGASHLERYCEWTKEGGETK